MSKHILIVYATRAGSTVEVAQVIGEVLGGRGFEVQIKSVKENPAVDGYQAVIIGSAIRMGNWLPEVVDFLRKNQPKLSQIPTAIFTCHRLNTGEDAASRAAREAYSAPIRQIVSPQAEAFFSGTLDHAKLNFVDRMLAQAVEKSTLTPAGDFRDWSRIRSWAQTVVDEERP